MHNLFHFLDLKLSIIGALFLGLSLMDWEISLKIMGSICFIGYNIHRWVVFAKERNKKDKES